MAEVSWNSNWIFFIMFVCVCVCVLIRVLDHAPWRFRVSNSLIGFVCKLWETPGCSLFCPGPCCSLDGHLHSGIASSSGGHQRHWRQKENVNLFPPPVFSPNWDGGQQLATADVEGSTGFFRSPFCRVGDPIPGSGWGRGREGGRQAGGEVTEEWDAFHRSFQSQWWLIQS